MNRRNFLRLAWATVGMLAISAQVPAQTTMVEMPENAGHRAGREAMESYVAGFNHDAESTVLANSHTHSLPDHTHGFVLHDQTMPLRDLLARAQPGTTIYLAPGQFTENIQFGDGNAL